MADRWRTDGQHEAPSPPASCPVFLRLPSPPDEEFLRLPVGLRFPFLLPRPLAWSVGRSVCLPLVLYVFNNLSVCLPLYPSVSFFSLPSPSVISRVPSPISSLPSLPTTLYFPLSPLLYPLSFVQEIVFQLSSCFLSPTIILRKLFFVCHVYVLDV